jgi:methionine-rich copper-binding protein CopC
MIRTVLGFALCAALSFAATPVQAHSHLQSSDPAANAELASSPAAIRLTFSMPVEAKFSTIRLLDARGTVIPTAAAASDGSNPKLLVLPLSQPLPAGEYKVEWKVVSTDSHPMTGDFSFTIKQ